MKATYRLVITAFCGVGLVMLTIALLGLVSTIRFRMAAFHVEGTVVDLEARSGSKGRTTYAPVYEFTDHTGVAHRHEANFSSSPSHYDVGDPITVYYNPSDPDDARPAGFAANWLLPLVFGLFGMVFGGIGAAFLVAEVRRARLRADMLKRGRRTECRVVGVEPNTDIRINGRHPWRVKVQLHDPYSGETRHLLSEDLYFDPSEQLDETIDVLIDPNDSQRYWVDISALTNSRKKSARAIKR